MKPQQLQNRDEYFRELCGFNFLDLSEENELNDMADLAARTCEMPVSVINLPEFSRQWIKSQIGLNMEETPLEMSYYAGLTDLDGLFEIKDTRKIDLTLEQFTPQFLYFACIPLISSRGYRMGTLSVADIKPNVLNELQAFTLKVLGQQLSRSIELKAAARRMQVQHEKLTHENEMQQMMLSIIAHDVRNPIGAIKGIMDFLATNEVPEIDRQKLTLMFTDQLDSTMDLLNSLVEWSKMQLCKTEIVREKLNLHEQTEMLLKQFQLNAKHKNNRLVNLVDKDLYIHTDQNMFKFIIRNLVANACKYTQDGTITLYAHGEKDYIMFSVSDTGMGMEPERVKTLFQKCRNNSTKGTDQEKGSGLGLILTRGFIDCLGARIEVESELGKGTTMYLYFSKM